MEPLKRGSAGGQETHSAGVGVSLGARVPAGVSEAPISKP